MTTENQEQPGQQQQQTQQPPQQQDAAQADKDADKAFTAGFDDDSTTPVSTASAPEDQTKKPRTAPAKPADGAASSAAAAASAEAPRFAGFTEIELKNILSRIPDEATQQAMQRQFKQINGWIGNFNAKLSELTKPASAAQPAAGASTPRLNSEAMKKLREDLPDVADAIEAAIAAMPSMPGGPSKEEIEQLVHGRVSAALDDFRAGEQRQQQRLLIRQHPDWVKVRGSPDFKTWLAAQPQEYQIEVSTADDAATVSECLAKFKDWKKKQGQPSEEEKRRREEDERQKRERQQNRLEAAVSPTGVAAPGQQTESIEKAFQEGFANG